jgi:gluconokinase
VEAQHRAKWGAEKKNVPSIPPRAAEHPLVLALDLGSSSLRALVYDRLGRELQGTEGRVPTEWRRTREGGVEADPDALLDGAFRAIDQALAAAGPSAAGLRAVGISTFWHNILGVGADGRPATPLYSWADERSARAALALRTRLDEEAVRQRTGCVFHPSYPAARLLWLRDAASEAFRAVRTWMSIGEYLALRCFGRTVCSVSMASGTGLFDQRRCAWDDEVLEAVGIGPDRLAPLGDLTAPLVGLLPSYAARWAVLAGIPWLPAAGDGALSNVGCGCVTSSRAALAVGTTGALRVLRAGAVPRVPRGLWIYRADRARVLSGGAVSNGGNVYRWLQEVTALGAAEEIERALRERPPNGHGLVVLPFLAGERSPEWPLAARGAVVGLTLATDPFDLLQASLEAVAYRFAMIWDALRGAVPEVREIVASGGALLRSPAWMQIMADALGHDLIASGEEEGSSRGAALVALEVLGAAQAETTPAPLGRVYSPDPARHARYRDARARQRRVEEALAPLETLV